MGTIKDCARAFVAGREARCHNAVVTVDNKLVQYKLHGHIIAQRRRYGGPIEFNWCGWHTPTTANHMNHILDQIKGQLRVSYSRAAKLGVTSWFVEF